MGTIALPSGKSIEERSVDHLRAARIMLSRQSGSNEALLEGVSWPHVARFVKPTRIPKLVESGEFNVGITGLDAVREAGARVEVCADLEFNRGTTSKARIVVIGPESGREKDASAIPDGSSILSEYPRLTRAFFTERGKNVTVVSSVGSVEAEIPDIYPYGVCLTETGTSLRANRLRAIDSILESSVVLIANRKVLKDRETAAKVSALAAILRGVVEARGKVLLTMNVPDTRLGDVLKLLPAMRNPTVTSLSGTPPFHSVSAVVPATSANHLIVVCAASGAEGFLVSPISAVIATL